MKRIAVIVLFVLVLSGCSALIEDSPPSAKEVELQQTQAAIAVALTMDAQQAISLKTRAYQTVVAELTQTVLSFTDTPEPPTDTPEPSPTPEPVLTLAVATATQSPIPATNYVKPEYVNGLGIAHFKDTFASAENWFTYDGGGSSAQVKNGVMRMTMDEPNLTSDWTLSWISGQNFYAEVTAETGGQCTANDRYGMVFRAPNPNGGYLFMISCEGAFRLTTWDGASALLLAGWKKSDDINAGANQSNVLGVFANGDQIMLYINGEHQRTVYDQTFFNEGRFGLIIGSEKTDDLTIEYDNFKMWYID